MEICVADTALDGDSSEAETNSIYTSTSVEASSQPTLSNISEEASLYMTCSEGTIQTHEPSVQTTAASQMACTKDCECKCHSRPSRARPLPATSIIYGWLRSVYNGLPRPGTQRRDVFTCRRAHSPSHFDLRIPRLFCSRVLEDTSSLNKCLDLFVLARVNAEEKNPYDRTVLFSALYYRNENMLTLLTDAGYRFDNLPGPNNDLLIAAWCGSTETISILERNSTIRHTGEDRLAYSSRVQDLSSYRRLDKGGDDG
ncbi:hypothetical protein F5Y11DRAFT_363313 [Daldinia sp. FL1419]|nr:hypothetical protein F5Y11DRAFT_363313 [Daldinia sp. FL1419]